MPDWNNINKMTERQLLFRVDANKQIGTGHFFRCLYLARALRKKRLSSIFLMADADGNIPKILKTEGFELVKIDNDCKANSQFLSGYLITQNFKRSLLVVDSPYPSFYEPSFQDEIRKTGSRLMMITFRSEGHFKADIIHNQNLLALEECYSVEPYTRLILGPSYVILDERFGRLRKEGRTLSMGNADTLFLFFGGADESNLTLKVLKSIAVLEQPLKRIITIVGQLHGRVSEISDFIRANPAMPIDLHIDTSDMPKLMSAADIAVTSGGLSIWELASFGIPVVIISTSERERIHTPLLEKRGTCLYLGHKDEVTEQSIRESVTELVVNRAKRVAMSQAGYELIDGNGTARVAEHVINLLSKDR